MTSTKRPVATALTSPTAVRRIELSIHRCCRGIAWRVTLTLIREACARA